MISPSRTMDRINILLTVAAFSCSLHSVAGQRPFNDLRARFAFTPSDGFYELPLNTSSPLMQSYVQTPADSNLNPLLSLACYPDDPRVCLMYDPRGNIAGIQITYLAQDVSDVNPVPYNYSAVGGFVPTNVMNTPGYAFRAYFTNPETLTTAGRQLLNETVEGLWVYLDGQLVEIQRNEPLPTETYISGFYRQACFPGMGQHYFYRMAPNISCSDLLPFYPVYQDGGLVGFGIVDFGRASDGPTRLWYERPTLADVQAIITSAPTCLDTWTQEYGFYSLHVYFIDHPWEMTCPA